jgi:hypothetical protein
MEVVKDNKTMVRGRSKVIVNQQAAGLCAVGLPQIHKKTAPFDS